MKKIFCLLFSCCCVSLFAPSVWADTFSCGDGYVLVEHNKIDGVPTMACEKLWCMDLENGQIMGNGNSPANGYRSTNEPITLRVKEYGSNNTLSIKCFGDRKWCSGEVAGEWMEEYGGYTRGGEDAPAYKSYQKSGCFAWRLEKPTCDSGLTAVLDDGKWVCVTEEQKGVGTRASTIRRTGSMRLR